MVTSSQTLTLATIIATETGIALTMAEQTLSVARAAVRTVLRHVLGNARLEGDLLLITIIIVQRYEPMTGLHVARHLTIDRRLLHK